MSFYNYFIPSAPPPKIWPIRPVPSRDRQRLQYLILELHRTPITPPISVPSTNLAPLLNDFHNYEEDTDGHSSTSHNSERNSKGHPGLCISPQSKTIQKKGSIHDFTSKQKEILYSWWVEHFHFPRPSREDLIMLAKACKVHVSKVYKWFDNQRTRYLTKNGDAPFLGATKRGRPAAGQRDQPIVIDVREISDLRIACQTILEQTEARIACMLFLHIFFYPVIDVCIFPPLIIFAVEPSVVIICVSKPGQEQLEQLLRDNGAVRFRHAHHGQVLVVRPTATAKIAERWPIIREYINELIANVKSDKNDADSNNN